MKLFNLTIFLIFHFTCYSQKTAWCFKGLLFDEENNKPIAYAHISTNDYTNGTTTNENGSFELCKLSQDNVEIIIQHTAYEKKKISISKNKNSEQNISLKLKKHETREVTIISNSTSTTNAYIAGKQTIKSQEILITPTLLGTPDVVRTLQLMPGIQSVNEGNSGIYVRGGSPGQNYIVFDGIELLNPSHVMGFYSVFNPLLVNQVDFYKGNSPIRYANKLASSIIVNTHQNVSTGYNWSGNLGNISSNLTYNGKSKNEKWYLNTGFRRSYIEILKQVGSLFIEDEKNYFQKNDYAFYDFNGKLRYQHQNNTLNLSWYSGQDRFKLYNQKNNIDATTKWGNQGLALAWKHLFSPAFTMNNSFDYSGYFSNFNANYTSDYIFLSTHYSHLKYKSEYLLSQNNNTMRWGIHSTYYYITPQELDISAFSNYQKIKSTFKSLSNKLFLSNLLKIKNKWSLYTGVAIENYQVLPPDISPSQNQVTYQSNDWKWNFSSSLNFNPTPSSSLKASYAFISQNMHLASLAAIPLPTDVWMPATSVVPHEKGEQVTLGFFKDFKSYDLEFGSEIFGKKMDNQLLLQVNTNNEIINRFEDYFIGGESRSYGAELFLKKKTGKLYNSISYTLAWADQKFPSINENTWGPAKYDRRHDLNLLTNYKLNKRIDFGLVFIYATGNNITLPVGRYWMMGTIANDYGGENNYRMPPYHRLDLSFNYHLKSKFFFESIINISIINAYNRSNPFFIYYHIDQNKVTNQLTIKAKQSSLFPIIPSVSWRFKF